MKKLLYVLPLFFLSPAFAQTLPKFDEIVLEQASDFKNAEVDVIKAANYMLTTPFDKDDVNRLKSLQFIIKWMSGTPNYSFALDDMAAKLMKGSDDLLGLYMVCMAKYCLENPASAKDLKAVKLNSIKLVLTYCENDANKMKMNKQLKKLSEANKKGELEKEL